MTREQRSTEGMTMRLYRTDDHGRQTTERHIALPAGLTYAQCEAYARRFIGANEHLGGVYEWTR